MSLVLTDEQLKDLLDTSKPRPTKDFTLDMLGIGQLRKLAGLISGLKIKQADMKAMGKDELIGEIRRRIPNIEARIEEGEFAPVGVAKDRKLENLNVAALRKLVTKYNKDIAIPKYKTLSKEELIAEIRKRFPMLEFKPDVRQPLPKDEEVIVPKLSEMTQEERKAKFEAGAAKAKRRKRLEKIYENYRKREGPQALRQLKRRTSDSILEQYGGTSMEETPPPSPEPEVEPKKIGRPRKPRDTSTIVEAAVQQFREEEAEEKRQREEGVIQVIEEKYKGKTYFVDVNTNDVYDPDTEGKMALRYDPIEKVIKFDPGEEATDEEEETDDEDPVEYVFLSKGDPGTYKEPRNEEEKEVYSYAELNVPTYQNNLAALEMYEEEVLPTTMGLDDDYEPKYVDGILDTDNIPEYRSVNEDIKQDAYTLFQLAEMTPDPFMRNIVLQAAGQDYDEDQDLVFVAPHDRYFTIDGNFRDEDGDIDEVEIPYQIVYTIIDADPDEDGEFNSVQFQYNPSELNMLYVAGYQREKLIDNPFEHNTSIINPFLKDGNPPGVIPIGRIYFGGKKEYDNSLDKDVYEYQAFTLSSRDSGQIETKEMIPDALYNVIEPISMDPDDN